MKYEGVPEILSHDFNDKTHREFSRFFPNYFKNSEKVVPQTLSNHIKNKKQVVLELRSNFFKDKTQEVAKIFSELLQK